VRRRSKLEDRALFSVRVVAIGLLAVLGATPFLRCSRLSLQRSGGASVAMAVVVDDSMSMLADAGGTSRFERARLAARELLASAREGDAVAIVLAGAPARVGLAATTDLAAARDAIDAVSPSHRATDLDGALVVANGLVASLPQVDRRIVVLSDLADGRPEAPPLGEASSIPVWVALPELRTEKADCALMRADRRGNRVRVEVACGPGQSPAARDVVVEDPDGRPLGRASPPAGRTSETTVLLPSDDSNAARARLLGADAIAADDVAPVVAEAGRGAIAVVADATDEAVATGGAPIVEQALGALKLDLDVRSIPAFPDRVEDLAGDLGVLMDDPPGMTPEQRHAMAAFLGGGGVALLALGPRAARAPLGATLEPALTHSVAWSETKVAGADAATATAPLTESAASLTELGAVRRASLAPEDVAAFEPLLKWADGAPLVARRTVDAARFGWSAPVLGRRERAHVASCVPRAIDGWARAARGASPQTQRGRGDVDVPRSRRFRTGARRSLQRLERRRHRLTPRSSGYRITIDGKAETRVAAPAARG
jgi:hypothetical protein